MKVLHAWWEASHAKRVRRGQMKEAGSEDLLISISRRKYKKKGMENREDKFGAHSCLAVGWKGSCR